MKVGKHMGAPHTGPIEMSGSKNISEGCEMSIEIFFPHEVEIRNVGWHHFL